jgi:hypothetical protein
MELRQFLSQLDAKRISYRLDRVRDATMVMVFVPGEHWEVEFMDEGGIEIERFRSDGVIGGEDWLGELFRLGE